MRVALCLSGEMRTFDSPECYQSLKKYIIEPLAADVFISTWSHRGISAWSQKVGLSGNPNEKITVSHIEKYIPNCRYVEIADYNEWVESLPENRRLALGEYVGSSIPDLYGVYRSCWLTQSNAYDMVIRARPDNWYSGSIPKESIENLNFLWNQNCHPTYYPSRLYTILYWSNISNMMKITYAYNVMESLWDKDVGTSLSRLDPCKNMAVHAKNCGIEIRSIDRQICEVHR